MVVMFDWKMALTALVVGVIVGVIFGGAGLPIPAPGAAEGILGIAGIYIGGAVLGPWLRALVVKALLRQ